MTTPNSATSNSSSSKNLSSPLIEQPAEKKKKLPHQVEQFSLEDLYQINLELSRRHLLPFIQLTKPDYIADRFHIELCEIVEECHRPAATIPTSSEMTLKQGGAESRNRISLLSHFRPWCPSTFNGLAEWIQGWLRA